MIHAAVWLWGLWRALQRPLEGQTCPWCGGGPSRVPVVVSTADFEAQMRKLDRRLAAMERTTRDHGGDQ